MLYLLKCHLEITHLNLFSFTTFTNCHRRQNTSKKLSHHENKMANELQHLALVEFIQLNVKLHIYTQSEKKGQTFDLFRQVFFVYKIINFKNKTEFTTFDILVYCEFYSS